MTVTGAQFERRANLIVANTTLGTGRDLSELQFRFSVRQADLETPNTLIVRIYNLSEATENEITTQYNAVTLQVGYKETGVAVLFTGTIKMFRKGKETSVDKYLEIAAADGDIPYNFGFVSKTLAEGSSQEDAVAAAAAGMNLPTDSEALFKIGGILVYPRGKVMFGLPRIHLADAARTQNCRWSIESGKIVFTSITGYLPGDVVVLSSTTGMVGIPESTPDGINVRCFLNPKIIVGRRVQIAASDILSLSTSNAERQRLDDVGAPGGINFPGRTEIIYPATVQRGLGIYRVLVAEHDGDTREQDWYSDLTCLALDPSAAPDASVSATG